MAEPTTRPDIDRIEAYERQPRLRYPEHHHPSNVHSTDILALVGWARHLEALRAADRDNLVRLERWAAEQNAGNAFATQVRLWATTQLDEFDLPAEKREP